MLKMNKWFHITREKMESFADGMLSVSQCEQAIEKGLLDMTEGRKITKILRLPYNENYIVWYEFEPAWIREASSKAAETWALKFNSNKVAYVSRTGRTRQRWRIKGLNHKAFASREEAMEAIESQLTNTIEE